jgi:hypothetical protein
MLVPAYRAWRNYLLDDAQKIEPYTQHAFIIRERSIWDERMGMTVAYIHNLVFTQIGPLTCFGLIGADGDPMLRESMVKPTGGVLPSLIPNTWNPVLTDRMLNTMDHADVHCNIRVMEFSKTRKREPLLWSQEVKKRARGKS